MGAGAVVVGGGDWGGSGVRAGMVAAVVGSASGRRCWCGDVGGGGGGVWWAEVVVSGVMMRGQAVAKTLWILMTLLSPPVAAASCQGDGPESSACTSSEGAKAARG